MWIVGYDPIQNVPYVICYEFDAIVLWKALYLVLKFCQASYCLDKILKGRNKLNVALTCGSGAIIRDQRVRALRLFETQEWSTFNWD